MCVFGSIWTYFAVIRRSIHWICIRWQSISSSIQTHLHVVFGLFSLSFFPNFSFRMRWLLGNRLQSRMDEDFKRSEGNDSQSRHWRFGVEWFTHFSGREGEGGWRWASASGHLSWDCLEFYTERSARIRWKFEWRMLFNLKSICCLLDRTPLPPLIIRFEIATNNNSRDWITYVDWTNYICYWSLNTDDNGNVNEQNVILFVQYWYWFRMFVLSFNTTRFQSISLISRATVVALTMAQSDCISKRTANRAIFVLCFLVIPSSFLYGTPHKPIAHFSWIRWKCANKRNRVHCWANVIISRS